MEKTFINNKCNISYKITGAESSRTIILLHGYGLNHKMWEPQLPALSSYRVILADVRGHGNSKPCKTFSIPAAAEDVHQIVLRENCDRPILIGLSMGGYIAQEYARWFGENLGGCMVVGATPMFIKYPFWEKLSLKYSALIFR